MSWFAAILIATFFFSLCVLLDKFVHTGKIKSVYSFAIILNIIYFPLILATALIYRNSFHFGLSFVYSSVAGVFWFLMWIFFWKALQVGEASRVSAVFFTQPIYSALFGIMFLHESLNLFKWIGITVIVAGAIMSSLGGESHKKEVKIAYLYALLAALLSSSGNIVAKYAMSDLHPLMVNSIAFFMTTPLYLFLFKGKEVQKEVGLAFKNIKLLTQFGIRGIVGYTGILFNLIAMGSGPISLVSAIGGSQPIMIIIISLVGTALFPKLIHEDMSKKTLIPKLTALILTVAGVAMVSF